MSKHREEKIQISLFSGLGGTLAISFLMFALIPVMIVSLISYSKSYKSLEREISKGLKNATILKTREIDVYFKTMLSRLSFESKTEKAINLLSNLKTAFKDSGEPLSEFVNSKHWALIVEEYGVDIERFKEAFNYYDVIILTKEGDIIYSLSRESDMGTNLFKENGGSKFAKSCRRTIKTGNISFSDYEQYLPSGNNVYGFITAPVSGENGEIEGVMVFQFTIDPISRIMKSRFELGLTSQTYLVGPDLTLRSALKLEKKRTLINERIMTRQTELLEEQINSDRVNDKHEELVFIYEGPLGREVIGVHNEFIIGEVVFAVVAEIDTEEAFIPLAGLRRLILMMIFFTVLFVSVFTVVLTRKIVKPLMSLTLGARRVADGDYSQLIRIKEKNEIGELAVSFNAMVVSLEKANRENSRSDWFKTGQAELVDYVAGESDLSEFCRKTVTYLARYLKARTGGLYVAYDEKFLSLTGSYAFPIRKPFTEKIEFGQGLVGQAARDKEKILVDNLPVDYISIHSGLGDAAANAVVISPLMYAGEVMGVVELGTLESFSDEQIEFIDLISENIAVSIKTIRAHKRVNELLAETREQAKELEQASRYKSEFLANMSHELRTPLNSILILARLLANNDEGNLDEEELESARVIYNSGEDLLTLINEILDLAKIEAGKMEVQNEEVDLSALIDSIKRQFSPLSRDKGIAFNIDLSPDIPQRITTDRQRLEQILRNFLSNAFKFTEQGAVSLAITTAADDTVFSSSHLTSGNALAFMVSDTGPGIESASLKNLFKAFHQGDGSISRKYGGTGLGLAISQSFAMLLKGEIVLESEPGKGAVLTLYLPYERRSNKPSAFLAGSFDTGSLSGGDIKTDKRLHGQKKVLEGRKILVADDDLRNSFALSGVLEREGLTVILAENGKAALEKLDKEPDIEIVIMDIIMPVMDGYQAIREIRSRKKFKEIPILALTAKAMAEDREKCILEGASQYLSKPVEPAHLISVIKLMLKNG